MTENPTQLEAYTEGAIRTDLSPEQYEAAGDRIKSIIRLEHAGHGITTETGELMDTFKRFVYYGKPIDPVNVKEETGDLFWYLAILMDELDLRYGIKSQEILDTNIAKLKARFPQKFDESAALNRDLTKEREVLEANVVS